MTCFSDLTSWIPRFLREEKVLVTLEHHGSPEEGQEVQRIHQLEACLGHEVRQVHARLQADPENPEVRIVACFNP